MMVCWVSEQSKAGTCRAVVGLPKSGGALVVDMCDAQYGGGLIWARIVGSWQLYVATTGRLWRDRWKMGGLFLQAWCMTSSFEQWHRPMWMVLEEALADKSNT